VVLVVLVEQVELVLGRVELGAMDIVAETVEPEGMEEHLQPTVEVEALDLTDRQEQLHGHMSQRQLRHMVMLSFIKEPHEGKK
jgi:hypothetical protein